MGRKKKSKHFKHKPRPSVIVNGMSCEEQEFRTTVEFLEYTLPHQLSDWKRHFLNEKNFLKAGNAWLMDKCNGVRFPRIEDDVDKGLMRKLPPFQQVRTNHNPMVPSSAPARQPWQEYQEDWEEDWYSGYYGSVHGSTASGTKPKWWQFREPLPAVPKIQAPSGLAFVDMATVF